MRRSRLLLALALAAAACGGDDDGEAPDASTASDPDAAAGAGLTLSYRDGVAQLPLAYLGYVRSGDTITQLYFEISNMDVPGCPSAGSPIPPQLLIVSGFAGSAPATRTFDDGVRVSFFDFTGALREEIEPASATAASVTVTELDLTAGVAQADAVFTFGTDGTATGSFVATHCDSLDTEE